MIHLFQKDPRKILLGQRDHMTSQFSSTQESNKNISSNPRTSYYNTILYYLSELARLASSITLNTMIELASSILHATPYSFIFLRCL